MKLPVLLLLSLITLKGFSQIISGKVVDEYNKPLSEINISVNKNIGVTSDENGHYLINIESKKSIVLIFSSVGYQTEKIRIPRLEKNQSYQLDITLFEENILLNKVIVGDKEIRKKGLSKIKPKQVSILPTGNSGVEAMIKTLPGVSSANELSSQYSVRGGNFDENLVYVNGIEIYRPFLISSSQQEGLSFINSDLVSEINFSSGGFEAKYGDKMSSVLDIKYIVPKKNKTSISTSLLGTNFHTQGVSKNKNNSFLIGLRYKTTNYILNSLDTDAEYRPRFFDVQSSFNFKIFNYWNLNILSNYNYNNYLMIPTSRDTEFGNINEALKLRIFFDGQEKDEFTTFFTTIINKFKISENSNLQTNLSFFEINESENYDIMGRYFLYQLDNNLGSNSFGDIAYNRGIGKYIDHSRNNLNANIFNLQLKGTHFINNTNLNWGVKLQKETFEDIINEWRLIDSAGYNIPSSSNQFDTISNNNNFVLDEVRKTEININSNRVTSFFQFSKDYKNLSLTAGTRTNYWSFNKELLLSPRISLAYAPLWEKDFVFRLASGVYYQSPFYKELRDESGQLNNNIRAQKSIHHVISSDYLFYSWGRPFKLVTEVYYKDLKNLIPYKIDNVRIQYLPFEKSNGYATGIDFKINGEFVNGVESWASLSIMKTAEDIVGDYIVNEDNSQSEVGFIPRPTDQRVNFSLFFQDYVPNNPNYKMHLNLKYGSGLPFGPPKSEKYEDILRIPSYRRVDIGFSAGIKSSKKVSRFKFLNYFEEIWLSAEVFNLLDINNTVSYIWVSDINGRQYAVPNYLTSRQLNARLIIKI